MAEPTEVRRVGRADLVRAAAAGVLAPEQATALWQWLDSEPARDMRPRFDLVHVLWCAGALIVIGAMGLFTTLAFAQLGGAVLALIAIVYAVIFTAAGDRLWRRGLRVPGGLLITVAVTMATLFTFGTQEALGWWTHADPGNYRDFYVWIRASWLPLELATIVALLVALHFYRFPFLVAPLAFALWFMSMDLVPWVFGKAWDSWEQRKIGSVSACWWSPGWSTSARAATSLSGCICSG